MPKRKPRIPKSLKIADQFILQAADLTKREAKVLARYHRTLREARSSIKQTIGALEGLNEPPPELFRQVRLGVTRIEKQVNTALAIYEDQHVPTRWLREVGCSIEQAAIIYALLDVEKVKTISGLYRFAGLDPSQRRFSRMDTDRIVNHYRTLYGTVRVNEEMIRTIATDVNRNPNVLVRQANFKWNTEGITWAKFYKILRRSPWCIELREALYRASYDFLRPRNHGPSCPYTELYKYRKAYEEMRNERGDYQELARTILQEKTYNPNTTAFKRYSQGHLPQQHIVARSMRHTAKIFLGHFYQVIYFERYGKQPKMKPYVIDVLGKSTEILCPKWPYKE